MSKIWIEVNTDDFCMWQLKGKVYTEKPELDEMQESVGGLIEYYPKSMVVDDVREMIVNEEGMIRNLPINQLATQQLGMNVTQPVFGNALLYVDEKFITKQYWFEEEE
jgi:hypothetical protein